MYLPLPSSQAHSSQAAGEKLRSESQSLGQQFSSSRLLDIGLWAKLIPNLSMPWGFICKETSIKPSRTAHEKHGDSVYLNLLEIFEWFVSCMLFSLIDFFVILEVDKFSSIDCV